MSAEFLDPSSKEALAHLQIPTGLHHRNSALLGQPDRLQLELPAELSPHHLHPPILENTLNSVSTKPAVAHRDHVGRGLAMAVIERSLFDTGQIVCRVRS